MDSSNNPADEIIRGKTLIDLSQPNQWRNGPAFLKQPHNSWLVCPKHAIQPGPTELRGLTFGSLTTIKTRSQQLLDLIQYSFWKDLVQVTYDALNMQTSKSSPAPAYRDVEISLVRQCQAESFPMELKSSQTDKSLHLNSKLRALAPELDKLTGLIRVGGRLRNFQGSLEILVHPVVLYPGAAFWQGPNFHGAEKELQEAVDGNGTRTTEETLPSNSLLSSFLQAPLILEVYGRQRFDQSRMHFKSQLVTNQCLRTYLALWW